jgi:hypothetical protein
MVHGSFAIVARICFHYMVLQDLLFHLEELGVENV